MVKKKAPTLMAKLIRMDFSIRLSTSSKYSSSK
jgi:hypothetical protein